jgi:hypothetical protein
LDAASRRRNMRNITCRLRNICHCRLEPLPHAGKEPDPPILLRRPRFPQTEQKERDKSTTKASFPCRPPESGR